MANSKTERSENVNAIELNCKVAKKLQPPPPISTSTPSPLFRFIPPFQQKNSYPPSDSIFGRSYPSFNKGEGGSNYEQLTAESHYFYKKAPPKTINWVVIWLLAILSKKIAILNIFSKFCKTLCVFILIFYFVAKIRKTCYRKKKNTDLLKPIY